MKQRILFIMIMVAVCFAVSFSFSFAENTEMETGFRQMQSQYNPLYEDVENLSHNEDVTNYNKNRKLFSESMPFDPDDYLTDYDDATAELRKQMVKRDTTPEVMLYVRANDENEVSSLFKEIFFDAMEHTGNPEEGDSLQWVWNQYAGNMFWYSLGNEYYVTYSYDISYYTTAKQEAELSAAVDALKATLNVDECSDYEKVCAIYDYMCDNITYDYDNLDDDSYPLKYTAYAALIDKTAVCQGYATLFYRLALEYDVDARVIAGTAGGAHGWNIVKLGNKYYYLDATWDAGYYTYDYFLKGSNMFLIDHTPYEEYTTSAFQNKYPISATDYVLESDVSIAAPTITLATVSSSGKPKVTWKAVDGATGYEVWRKVGSAGEYEKYYTTSKGTSLTNTSTKPGTVYYYKVRAFAETSANTYYSPFSGSKYIACDLAQPTGLKVTTNASNGKPKVTWSAVKDADKYEVYRKVGSSGKYKLLTTTTSTSVTNKSATAGTVYYYKVKAICGINSGGNSAYSAADYVTCDLARPQISVSGTKKPGKIVISWSKVSGADRYYIYRATSKNGTYSKYATTTGTTYTNTSVKKGNYYYYKIKAVYDDRSAANSAYSNVDYAWVR